MLQRLKNTSYPSAPFISVQASFSLRLPVLLSFASTMPSGSGLSVMVKVPVS